MTPYCSTSFAAARTPESEKLRDICSRYGVARLEVFDSVSRGEAGADSDVAILYELISGGRLGWDIEKLADELSGLLGRPVDLVSRNALHERRRDDVLAEARLLFVRPELLLIQEMIEAAEQACARRGRSGSRGGGYVRRGALEPGRPVDEAVTIGFWHLGSRRPVRQEREVDAAPWARVRRNYAAAVRPALERLMTLGPEEVRGRLLLLHGEPGTGKTTALRTLADGWRRWWLGR